VKTSRDFRDLLARELVLKRKKNIAVMVRASEEHIFLRGEEGGFE